MRPTGNGHRNLSVVRNKDLAARPLKRRLLSSKHQVAGRSHGKISIRHRGGGQRTHLRIVDFSLREKMNIPGKIKALEYDPKRTAYLALISFADGDYRYALAHSGAKVGDSISIAEKGKPITGHRLPLAVIPSGFSIFNVEITPGKGGQMVRSAGQSATLVSTDDERYAQVQMPSGEIRLFPKDSLATIGKASNEEHSLERIGKAGRVRRAGRRPQVRGKAMNPCDHPHGGGEGGASIGMKYPKTPWGAPALGVKTRSNKRTDRLVLTSRHRRKS